MAKSDNQSDAGVLVIGAGPGGYAAAFRAADLGMDVTLVSGDEKPGGVCLQRGCIPSKTLLSLAELIREADDAKARGVSFGEPTVDLKALRSWRDEVVEGLTDGLRALCEQRGVRFITGRARLEGDGLAHVEGEEASRIAFGHAILATGSRPASLPDIPFVLGARIMDSTGALTLEDIPERLLVVGGGYVGLELGQVYARLGSRVTLVEAADRLLPGADRDLVKPLAARLDRDFAEIRLETGVAGLEEKEDGVEATLDGGGRAAKATFDRVLVAIGRRPNTEDLGLEATAIQVDRHGFVAVDDRQRTTETSIYAVGDVTGGTQLAHAAMAQGKVAAEVIAGKPAAFDPRAVPAVVYTDPQIAWCGVTEDDAEAGATTVVRCPWRSSGRARSIGADDGLTKLVLDAGTSRIRGVGIVGHDAEALIAEGVLAIELGAVAEDLALAIHPHPTLSETLGEAAEAFLGMPTHFAPGGRKRKVKRT